MAVEPVERWHQSNIVTVNLEVKYYKNRLMTRHQAIGKQKGVNQKSVAILRMRERGIGVAELTLIDFMRKLLCLNTMT